MGGRGGLTPRSARPPGRSTPIDDGVFSDARRQTREARIRRMRDPRFARLYAKLGLCDYWVKSGQWPDWAEEGVTLCPQSGLAVNRSGISRLAMPASPAAWGAIA
jgi:hypothetical protein